MVTVEHAEEASGFPGASSAFAHTMELAVSCGPEAEVVA